MEEWEGEKLPPISLDEVTVALRGFKGCTGVGHYGWHPRVLAQLPDEGLRCITKLLELVEVCWVWPNSMKEVDMVRIAKETGGQILIGILVTIYRLWGKVRRPACIRWEAAHNDGTDFATTGQSA